MVNLKTGVPRKLSTPKFPKNEHFLSLDTHTEEWPDVDCAQFESEDPSFQNC